ncbi:MAG TPA: HEAT repeat domain-containing protein [Bellilinea sp.]|nr:HEAT repeat domain-containing protein [Bellilinea sp.]
MEQKTSSPLEFSQVLDTLKDPNKSLSARVVNRLSDLPESDLSAFAVMWQEIGENRKIQILNTLTKRTGEDTTVSYDDIAFQALKDPAENVKVNALHLLNENNSKQLLGTLVDLISKESIKVKEAAIQSMGKYVLSGEMDTLPTDVYSAVKNQLVNILEDTKTSTHLRRRALESLGYAGDPEIQEHISKALASTDPKWVASALLAMGRSADESWQRDILKHLNHENPEIQLQAVRAAGELEIAQARQPLTTLLTEEKADVDVLRAAVLALSQIGGGNARKTLEKLMQSPDSPIEAKFIEKALENLELSEGFSPFGIMGIDDAEADEWEESEIVDEILRGEQQDEDMDEDDEDLFLHVEDDIEDEED